MRRILLLLALVFSVDSFARIEVCENVISSENVVSPDASKAIQRNHWGFDIVSRRPETLGKVLSTIKVLSSNQRWEYLWSEDSRFLKAVRVSGEGSERQIEALFVVDFQSSFVIHPYVLLNVDNKLERLAKVSLMGDKFVLARYGNGSTYEIIDILNGRVIRSTLPAKNDLQKKGRFPGEVIKISPGDLPESL